LAARLSSRTPESLGTFIASLAKDPDPLGNHVETFVVGDNLAEATLSIERDEDVMIQCGDTLAVDALMTRAAALFTLAAKSLPSAEVIKTMQRLVSEGDLGLRMPLIGIGMARNDLGKGVSGEKPSAPNP
jgi:hypothetical protein